MEPTFKGLVRTRERIYAEKTIRLERETEKGAARLNGLLSGLNLALRRADTPGRSLTRVVSSPASASSHLMPASHFCFFKPPAHNRIVRPESRDYYNESVFNEISTPNWYQVYICVYKSGGQFEQKQARGYILAQRSDSQSGILVYRPTPCIQQKKATFLLLASRASLRKIPIFLQYHRSAKRII